MIDINTDNGQAFLVVHGNLTAGAGDIEIVEVAERLVAEGLTGVVVDLAGAAFVDSSGLGALVRSYNTCRSAGVSFALAGVNPQLLSLLKIARLTDVFEILENDEA